MQTIIKTVDFNAFYETACFDERFDRTRPVSLTFYKRTFLRSNWIDLYVKFFEKVYALRPKEIEDVAFFGECYGIRPLLFIDSGKGENKIPYRRLGGSNVCLKTNYNVEQMLENIAETIWHLDLDVSAITIRYVYKKGGRLDAKSRKKVQSKSDASLVGCNFLRFKGYPYTFVDERFLSVLQKNYAQGFRFDGAMIALLEVRVRRKLRSGETKALKSNMYRRKDGLWFLNESVASSWSLCPRIAESANDALRKFRCFELKTLYERFAGELNPVCIRDADDFGNWFLDNFTGNIRVKKYGTNGEHRIVRVKSISQLEATAALVRKIHNALDKAYGTLEEDALLSIFDAFSLELLTDLTQKKADDVVVCQINGRTCFQTFDALGIPEELPNKLSKALEKIDELEFEPSLEIINALLTVAFGFNFRNYFNIPNDETYCRLIKQYYQGAPREWKAQGKVKAFKIVDG